MGKWWCSTIFWYNCTFWWSFGRKKYYLSFFREFESSGNSVMHCKGGTLPKKKMNFKRCVEHLFVMILDEVWWPQSLISRTYCYYTYLDCKDILCWSKTKRTRKMCTFYHFCTRKKERKIVFCFINLSNLLWAKAFDNINFPFTRNDRVWKMIFDSRFCCQGEAELVNPAWDSHFYNKIIQWIGNFMVEKLELSQFDTFTVVIWIEVDFVLF